MQGKIQHPFGGIPGGAPCPCGGAFWDHIPAPDPRTEQMRVNLAHASAIQAALTTLGKMIEDCPQLGRVTLDTVWTATRELERERDSFTRAAEFLKTSMETP